MAAPLPGKGTILQVSISSVFTALSNVLSVTPGEASQVTYQWEEIDSASVRRKGSGVLDGGELTVKCNYDPASVTQQYLIGKVGSTSVEAFKIIYSDANAEPFSAVVSKFAKDEITSVERVMCTFTLSCDGAPTFPTP